MAKKIGYMTAMDGSIRAICEEVNLLKIQREDIVSFTYHESSGNCTLVYFKYE